MSQVSYYVCDGPDCEATELPTEAGGVQRFIRVKLEVSRHGAPSPATYRYCSQRCLVKHLAPAEYERAEDLRISDAAWVELEKSTELLIYELIAMLLDDDLGQRQDLGAGIMSYSLDETRAAIAGAHKRAIERLQARHRMHNVGGGEVYQ